MIRRRVIVSGGVQGVFFRASCQQEASRHGVAGWVRNLPDGSVEAVFEGASSSVELLVAWCRVGPPRADVQDLKIASEDVQGERDFNVR